MCLYVPGFQRQVFKHVKTLSERSKESKEQKKNKESVFLAEPACNAQNAQFGPVMISFFLFMYFFVCSETVVSFSMYQKDHCRHNTFCFTSISFSTAPLDIEKIRISDITNCKFNNSDFI